MKKIPKITHLQFLILKIVIKASPLGTTAICVREQSGWDSSLPSFYQFMKRMERGGLIEGNYQQMIFESQMIRERRYKILPAGLNAYKETVAFYKNA